MIILHPIPDAVFNCPYCQEHLEVIGWYVPGMRNLADLKCPQCKLRFYGDLAVGHGLHYPMLLEHETGIVHDDYAEEWFAQWLRDSYANRVDSSVKFTVENFSQLKKPILLNCLDTLYGHSILKLLNAQYYIDRCLDHELILLIPRFLRWMVPDGVAEIWTVDLSLNRGVEWNDWIASEIKCRIEPFEACWLSVAFSHPHYEDFTIERFTRVQPFPVDKWIDRLKRPTVTFIWREDRLWIDEKRNSKWQDLPLKLKRRFLKTEMLLTDRAKQKQKVIDLACKLKTDLPRLDFAVVGIGKPGGFPEWITDLKTLEPGEKTEKKWCERYAQSHIVIGVHGSNMLLPSAHAGSIVELVPNSRWGNLVQDILLSSDDIRESVFRYRFLSIESTVNTVANCTVSLMRRLPVALLNFKRSLNNHEIFKQNPRQLINKIRKIRKTIADNDYT